MVTFFDHVTSHIYTPLENKKTASQYNGTLFTSPIQVEIGLKPYSKLQVTVVRVLLSVIKLLLSYI
ncbi:hypothetical protein HB162lentus_27120 [Mammaliicoccus lentus]